ncbi:MAG TPA: nuclear transport factor 2 family protein [Pyrinomonadaceae bacterium]
MKLALRLIVALFTFLIGLSSVAVLSPLRFDAAANGKAEQEIRQAESQYLMAHLQRDTATLDSLLADEFTIGRVRGRGMNKAERLALLEDDDFAFTSIQTDNVQVSVNGESAVVTGEAVVQGHYGDREFASPPYGFTRQYEKRQGRWQIVSVTVHR